MSRIIERELSDADERAAEEPLMGEGGDPDEDFDDKQYERELPNHAEAPKRGRPKKKAPPVPEVKPDEPPVDAVALAQKRTIAKRLIDELKATGTGLNIDACRSLQELDDEIAALDASLNNRRGQKGVQKALLFVVGLIEQFVSKSVPPEKFDIGATPSSKHLTEEIDENWELFDEVVQHLAIRHAAFFAVGPYATLGQGLLVCVHNVSEENKKRQILQKPADEKK